MARSGAAVNAPTFKYERPMDPATAMSKLEDIVDLFEGEVDITENEGPNQAMKATFYAKEVAGGLERAIMRSARYTDRSLSSWTSITRRSRTSRKL
jgi:hypothetical protein